MKLKTIAALIVPIIITFIACNKDKNPEPEATTVLPKIVSLTADKYDIQYGGGDPATINCEATGGSIEFVWEVDLGDIFPLNEDGSQVRFTGSECCLGNKYIKCTAKNDKGSVTDTIVINIYIP